MSLVTLGIYGLYWIYKSYAEVRAYRGRGVGGVGGVLLSFVLVGIFLLPAYVGRMEREEGREPSISGWSGLWAIVPYVGGLIWLWRVQSELNTFWRGAAAA